MGVNTDGLRQAGGQFLGIPRADLPRPQQIQAGLLSGGLVAAHNSKSSGANLFEDSMRTGLNATGNGLIQLADAMRTEDDMSAETIARLFPDQAPPVDGGQ